MNFLEKLQPGQQFKMFGSRLIYVYVGKGQYRRYIEKRFNTKLSCLPLFRLTAQTVENIRSVKDPRTGLLLGKKCNREDDFTWYF